MTITRDYKGILHPECLQQARWDPQTLQSSHPARPFKRSPPSATKRPRQRQRRCRRKMAPTAPTVFMWRTRGIRKLGISPGEIVMGISQLRNPKLLTGNKTKKMRIVSITRKTFEFRRVKNEFGLMFHALPVGVGNPL